MGRGWRLRLPRSLPAYWPVLLGTGIAGFFVVAGVTLAVQTLRRAPAPQPVAVTLSEKLPAMALSKMGPAPKVEAIIPPGNAKTAASVPQAKPAETAEEKSKTKEPAPAQEPDPVIALDEPVTEPPTEVQKCDTCGTSIKFMRSPQAAARSAGNEDKLVFLLHVSGNFEDSKFT